MECSSGSKCIFIGLGSVNKIKQTETLGHREAINKKVTINKGGYDHPGHSDFNTQNIPLL